MYSTEIPTIAKIIDAFIKVIFFILGFFICFNKNRYNKWINNIQTQKIYFLCLYINFLLKLVPPFLTFL
jgi:hypothetical protein